MTAPLIHCRFVRKLGRENIQVFTWRNITKKTLILGGHCCFVSFMHCTLNSAWLCQKSSLDRNLSSHVVHPWHRLSLNLLHGCSFKFWLLFVLGHTFSNFLSKAHFFNVSRFFPVFVDMGPPFFNVIRKDGIRTHFGKILLLQMLRLAFYMYIT